MTSASAARLRAAREHLVAERSWTVPAADEIDWTFAEWPVLRLLAVCALASEAGVA